MAVKFDVRQDEQGWTVFDCRTGQPARVQDKALTGLRHECADHMADSLNEPESEVWRNVSITGP